MATSEEKCPVCRDKITNPTQPSTCCGKVICQNCLRQSLQYRAHCPHCRSQVTNPTPPVADRRRFRLPILPRNSVTFNAERPVGRNIRNLLNQLQDAQAAQTNTANQASLPSQNALPPVPIPPVPLAQSISIPALENLQAELDEWPWQTEINLMQMKQQEQIQGSTVTTFVCPYCQEGGFDELDLLNHCNDEHANDSKRVVCPVCVALPHGDPQLYSRNFIGHLNLRHCYYISDITNVHQNDEVNIQCAIMASYAQNI